MNKNVIKLEGPIGTLWYEIRCIDGDIENKKEGISRWWHLLRGGKVKSDPHLFCTYKNHITNGVEILFFK